MKFLIQLKMLLMAGENQQSSLGPPSSSIKRQRFGVDEENYNITILTTTENNRIKYLYDRIRSTPIIEIAEPDEYKKEIDEFEALSRNALHRGFDEVIRCILIVTDILKNKGLDIESREKITKLITVGDEKQRREQVVFLDVKRRNIVIGIRNNTNDHLTAVSVKNTVVWLTNMQNLNENELDKLLEISKNIINEGEYHGKNAAEIWVKICLFVVEHVHRTLDPKPLYTFLTNGIENIFLNVNVILNRDITLNKGVKRELLIIMICLNILRINIVEKNLNLKEIEKFAAMGIQFFSKYSSNWNWIGNKTPVIDRNDVNLQIRDIIDEYAENFIRKEHIESFLHIINKRLGIYTEVDNSHVVCKFDAFVKTYTCIFKNCIEFSPQILRNITKEVCEFIFSNIPITEDMIDHFIAQLISKHEYLDIIFRSKDAMDSRALWKIFPLFPPNNPVLESFYSILHNILAEVIDCIYKNVKEENLYSIFLKFRQLLVDLANIDDNIRERKKVDIIATTILEFLNGKLVAIPSLYKTYLLLYEILYCKMDHHRRNYEYCFNSFFIFSGSYGYMRTWMINGQCFYDKRLLEWLDHEMDTLNIQIINNPFHELLARIRFLNRKLSGHMLYIIKNHPISFGHREYLLFVISAYFKNKPNADLLVKTYLYFMFKIFTVASGELSRLEIAIRKELEGEIRVILLDYIFPNTPAENDNSDCIVDLLKNRCNVWSVPHPYVTTDGLGDGVPFLDPSCPLCNSDYDLCFVRHINCTCKTSQMHLACLFTHDTSDETSDSINVRCPICRKETPKMEENDDSSD